MYISKTDREFIKNKFGGLCAYSGTELSEDWQVDHVEPVRRNWYDSNVLNSHNHNLDNMFPTKKIINHYKHSMNLKQFREFMQDFHIRIAKLPKNPRTEKSVKRKAYMLEIARLFDITPDKPFSGKFYFETLHNL